MRFGNVLIDSTALLRRIPVRAGMHVADFASGRTGHFVFPASQLVGEDGRVYAVDVHRPHLDYLHDLSRMCARPVETIWGDIECRDGVGIPPASLDVVLLSNAVSVLTSPDIVASEARRLLKAGGVFVMVDWKHDLAHPVAPPRHLRQSQYDVEQVFLPHGFVKKDDLPVSPSHWGVIFHRLDG